MSATAPAPVPADILFMIRERDGIRLEYGTKTVVVGHHTALALRDRVQRAGHATVSGIPLDETQVDGLLDMLGGDR